MYILILHGYAKKFKSKTKSFFRDIIINMDIEKKARRQSFRVITSEILMVIAVIATVSILAFVVSGYWVGSDFQIERQGLLQIYSSPTGADVEIDGQPSSWLQRTNTSKTLAAGEHTVVLSKDGYDSWSRTVDVTEGLLYRLHYPRLFLKNRYEESAHDFSATPVNFATVTPDRNTMLLLTSAGWQLFNLDSDSGKPVTLNPPAGLLSGAIKSASWATDNEHILFELEDSGTAKWVLFNVKTPAASVNLTKEFNANFSKVKILDGSASNLLVVLDGNLHRIDVHARQISAILVPGVVSFDYYHQEVFFSAGSADSADASPYYLGSLKLGSNETVKLKDLSAPAEVIVTRFYDDEYIGAMSGQLLTIYLKDNFEEKSQFNLSFAPESIRITNSGDAIIMNSGEKIASLDMEVMAITEWSPETKSYGWLDGSMIYAVKGGLLTVYDFNSLNPRELASGVAESLPVTITSDKYLYYFRGSTLTREWLVEH